MKLGFLELSPDDRRLYIEEAAARRGISVVIVEKDFWVSWLLGVIFNSEFSDSLVFKGGWTGTTLSELSPHFGLGGVGSVSNLVRRGREKAQRVTKVAANRKADRMRA